MEQLAILDGTILPSEQARLPVTDDGLLRGDGVFEVVRLYGGRPFAWAEHLERLAGSAENLRLPLDRARVERDARALLHAVGEVDAALRVVVTRGGHVLAMVEPIRPAAAAIALATVTYAPTRILDGVKSLSYAGNMLAGRLAVERGADEALLVTPHGRVLEAPTSSLFYVLEEDPTVYTPPLEDHILDSITRRRVAALVGARERVTTRDDLARFDEAFLASTLREVQAVRAVDGRDLPAVPGPRTAEAGDLLRAQVREELGA